MFGAKRVNSPVNSYCRRVPSDPFSDCPIPQKFLDGVGDKGALGEVIAAWFPGLGEPKGGADGGASRDAAKGAISKNLKP